MTVKMNYETRKAFDNYLFTKGYLVNWDGENQKDCVRSLYALADVFGIKAKGTDVDSGKLDKSGYVSVAEQLVERFGVKKVAITLRTSLSAFDNKWAGMLYDAKAKKAFFSTDGSVSAFRMSIGRVPPREMSSTSTGPPFTL